jgi:hypothetical protein
VHASPEKIADGIPESELRSTFVEHSRDTLDKLSTDRNWLRSGTVKDCHRNLLHTLSRFSKHLLFAKIFVSCGGMEAVAKFYASREKNDRPCPVIAEWWRASYTLLIIFLLLASDNNPIVSSNILGLLGQLIRCIPVKPEYSDFPFVQALQTCVKLVKKKLKSGTPTGDILDAVIAGKDGPINEKSKSCLVKLQSMVRLANDDYGNAKCCGYCDTKETQVDGQKLMLCKRCKLTYYCNKECQVAAWKIHKKGCMALNGYATGQISACKVSYSTIW